YRYKQPGIRLLDQECLLPAPENIQLGYTLPACLFSNTFISDIRVYATAENALTWNKYPKGWDPETNTGGNYYPFLATYTFGVNIKF
ncbi:MAG: hypothetical protein LIO97_12375, partial [Tannerellaceae bacterium]|nr:hypothetical protein [Tannerellaceae bacterium]